MAKFIVLDGGDGSGTTTQQGLLNNHLNSKGLIVYSTRNPSRGKYGRQLRRYLSNHVLKENDGIAYQRAMFGLFLADRRDMQNREIKYYLAKDIEVTCDRWSYSTMVYQSLESSISFEEILRAHEQDEILIPDLSLIFVGDPEILIKRALNRNRGFDTFETLEFQRMVDKGYRGLGDRLKDHNIIYINAESPIEEVALQVKTEVDRFYSQ